ncbi:MAG: glycosyltransferase family 1 protein [Prolixibacteraceae bacterium]|jgi:glycosyltransferase involved in cell wall biosynthesis|nr:glycosyltransferase family 4 protein [Prolixibacteraceae bacterium]MDI9563773.1 glycosyltransferase family 1 protein [Bacteroidota bacterium]NLT00009.1 glycosyltransferase family 4 protein [Bacteroidales bacterium]OQB81600.1 MAG: N-acetylgalactosamine-N,N'-diacetylbacillosaminyl-diphospho-undecaprenol 4-alpha-N-acetylgalactosaminyltransferase [Bacteroidetes bacterium ADurb.Bin123]HNU77663.1 glycosyltransferase family 1 protein [Prolixibacteraceae bacterium]
MKIGFDAKRAFLNKAGLGNYSRNTLMGLMKYHPQHQYLLYTPEFRTDLFKEYPFFETIHPAGSAFPFYKSFWRTFLLSGKIRKEGLDLFHGLSNELPAGIHRTKVPSVVTIHDLIFMNFPGLYKAVDRKIYFEKVRYACHASGRIIATSRQTRNDLIYHLNVDPLKVEVIYQGISERFFLNHYMEDTDQVLKRYRLPSRFILTVGTIEPRKNQLGVLRAIHRGNLDIPYVIVGKSTMYTELIMEYIEKHGLHNRVFILTNVPDFELPALYQKAECMVYLSHYEGFGLPIVEAMACGCPVITSSVSSLPEIGGEAVLYCNPDDEEALANLVSRVIENPALAKDMSRKGKKRAWDFHPENHVEALMDFYRKVADHDE